MKQTNPEKIQHALEVLEELKRQRGGVLLDFHKKSANDVLLLESFLQQYAMCNSEETTVLDRKIRELLLLALGCAKGRQTTIKTHGRLAMEHGATVEEIGEVLRLVFFYGGAADLIPAVELFELLEGSENL